MYLHSKDNFCSIDLNQLTSSELYDVLKILTKYNKNVYCVTSIIFELCYREFQSTLDSKSFVLSENSNLKRLLKYIEHLKEQGRFLHQKFYMLSRDLIQEDNITLEIIWWLDLNNLIYFEDYWSTKCTSFIVSQLKTLISSYADNELVSAEQEQQKHIVRTIFVKLLIGVNIQTSTVGGIKSQNIFNTYLNDALDELINSPMNAKLIGFIKVFDGTDCFYGAPLKNMSKNIIQRLITHEEEYTIYDAIGKQELGLDLRPVTNHLYFELIKRLTLEEFLEIIQEIPEQKCNWRYLLHFITVFISNVADSFKQLKSVIGRHLQSVFSEKTVDGLLLQSSASDVVQVLFSMILVRQACLEQPDPAQEYSDWFANAFGANSVLRTGTNEAAWTLLLEALYEALSQEPAWTLRVHVARVLRAPPHHHSDMLAYKDACRVRLKFLLPMDSVEDFL